MRIGLDVDGTVYDWESNFRSMLHRFHGLNLPVSVEWDSIEKSCTVEQWSSVWDSGRAELFTGGLYYHGAQRFVKELVDLKHEVVFITATPHNVRVLRAQCLFEDFPGIVGVVFTEPGSDDKGLVRCDLFVDDKPDVIITMSEMSRPIVVIDRPWNQNIAHVPRAYSWEGLLQMVNNL